MKKFYIPFISLALTAFMLSCSRKSVPVETTAATKTDTLVVAKVTDSALAVKPVVKRKVKAAIPKVITVNDQYAKKSVDGRYYYDLDGHRYWRSNKDGKYYIFNKSMLNDPAFKKPQ